MAGSSNGVTNQSISQNIAVLGHDARTELTALLAGEQTVETQTKKIGRYEVDGKRHAVAYYEDGDVAANRAAAQIDLVPGNTYQIRAQGKIARNPGAKNNSVSPTDKGDDGVTRLQLAETLEDGTVHLHNFTPNEKGVMEFTPKHENSTLGFVARDGYLDNNSGRFEVDVRETSKTKVETNVAIVADGIDDGTISAADSLDYAPEAGYLPEANDRYARASVGTALKTDGDAIETNDGYRIGFGDNRVDIDWPGDEGGAAETIIHGRNVYEGDAGLLKDSTFKDGKLFSANGDEIPPSMVIGDGNLILPNNALINVEYDGDKIKNLTVTHGDARVDVDGIGDGDPQVGEATEGGYDFRRKAVEANFDRVSYRMGGLNDGVSNLDITWNAEAQGRNLGVVDGTDGEFNRVANNVNYMVDPQLRPQFGTQDYERALRAEIEDIRSTISGGIQENYGTSADVAQAMADYMLRSSGAYQQYAKQAQSSVAARENGGVNPQQQQLEQLFKQLFGGMPQVQGDFNQAMQALQLLQALMGQQSGMQNAYQNAASSAQSHIPSVQQALQNQISPELLVEQALTGAGQNRRNRLERFDINQGGRTRIRNEDTASRFLRQRVSNSDGSSTTTKPKTKAERDALERTGVKGAMQINQAVTGLGGTDVNKIRSVLSNATNEERAEIKKQYKEMFGESVEDAIKGDTSFNTESSLLGLLNTNRSESKTVDDTKALQDAVALHDAMDSKWWNPDTYGTKDDKLQNLVTSRSPAELKRAAEHYKDLYGEDLKTAIQGDTSGEYEKILTDHLDKAMGSDYTLKDGKDAKTRAGATKAAIAIREAVTTGEGTNERALINALSGLSNAEKTQLKSIYKEMYGADVQDDIEGDTSGNFETTLVKLLNTQRSTAPATEIQAMKDAAILHQAVTVWHGTDDDRLMNLMTSRSPEQLKKMAAVYKDTYGESAKAAIEGDTSGWYEDALVAQLKLAD